MIKVNLNSFRRISQKILTRFRRKLKKHGIVEDCIVGYAQPYAVYVHESVGMTLKGKPRRRSKNRPSIGRYWDPPGAQAKFLEKAARMASKKTGYDIARSMKAGLSFQVSNLKAARQIQYDSQKMVPVDFGALIASAFTAKESEAQQEASKAFTRSEFLRPKISKK